MIINYVVGFIVYFSLAYLSYDATFKSSKYFYICGLALSLIANLSWMHITKHELVAEKLLVKSLVWDVMLTLTYIAVPILLFNAELSGGQMAGIVLVLLGIYLLH